MKFEKTFGIRKALSTYCAQAGSCFPTGGVKKAIKKKWVEDKDLYLGDISGTERVLVAVHFLTDYDKTPLLMDAVTGTLYRPRDGNCYSSDNLRMKKFTKAEGLAERLLNTNNAQYTESE